MLHEQNFEMSKKYGPVMTIYIGKPVCLKIRSHKTKADNGATTWQNQQN